MKKVKVTVLVLVLSLTIFTAYLFFMPSIIVHSPSTERLSYEESKENISKLQSLDGADVNNKCGSIFLDQGKKSAKTIVFYHGFTNCPEQFRAIGEKFFLQGYNVLIPRMPMHGLKDRLTGAPSHITKEQLVSFVNVTVKIASGLGDEVVLSGISGGGVLASWGGFYSNLVNKILVISPLFHIYNIDDYLLAPIVNIKPLLPDIYIWWDDETKEKIPGPDYAYPRFSVKGMISFLELSNVMQRDVFSIETIPNPNLKLVYISSENDEAVSNKYSEKVINKWSAKLNSPVTSYQFEKFYNFNHDIIDPNQATAKPEIVYSKIYELANIDYE